jgi:hypothetical protein
VFPVVSPVHRPHQGDHREPLPPPRRAPPDERDATPAGRRGRPHRRSRPRRRGLRGYVIAQAGPFKDKRGEFDRQSLEQIVQLGSAATRGVRAHFTHGGICDDQLGNFLGRSQKYRLDTTTDAAGQRVEAARGDPAFDPTGLKTPPKGGRPLGLYVMDLAESDPDARSSSLVVQVKRGYRLNADGTKVRDAKGEELPSLWRPYAARGSDIVSEGAAVDGLRSVDDFRDSHLWEGSAILDRLLGGAGSGNLTLDNSRTQSPAIS